MCALLSAFVGSAFALVRYALSQSRSVTDRFMSFLEQSLKRQEEVNDQFRGALEGLTDNVRENSALLQRVSERIGV